MPVAPTPDTDVNECGEPIVAARQAQLRIVDVRLPEVRHGVVGSKASALLEREDERSAALKDMRCEMTLVGGKIVYRARSEK